MIYDRAVLVDILIYHQAGTAPPPYTFRCGCGWGQRPEHLGRSHADHIADVYESSMLARCR